MVINGGDVSSDYYSIADNVTWNTSKVYKIVIVCSAYTSGSLSHQGGSASFGTNFGISSSIGGVGTFTNYAVPYQDGSITLRSQSFVGTLSSISIKEVTNDIVAYYPLDGDSSDTSSGVGITNDVTTGEVLGAEISGDPTFDNASNWTISLGNGGVDVNTTVSGKLSVVNALNTRLQKSGILTVGKLYKVTFVIDSYSSGRVRGLFDNDITFVPTGAGTYTRYFVASQTYFLISFDLSGGANMTMTDISIKEVTSNTGVLK